MEVKKLAALWSEEKRKFHVSETTLKQVIHKWSIIEAENIHRQWKVNLHYKKRREL